jgi:GT2 family glycosyltransferase/glycosyltransferase involved in cell wall biosynthesis
VHKLKVSVVINTFDRPLELEKAIEALLQSNFIDFEIVIVCGPDDGSSERMVTSRFPQVRIARTPYRNLSVSRNVGIKNSIGQWIAFLDDDGIPEWNWLTELLNYAELNALDVCSGPLISRTGLDYQAISTFSDTNGDSKTFKHPNFKLDIQKFFEISGNHFPSVVGANFIIKREVLSAIGGYDEEYEYYLDETDLCIRAHQQGFKISHSPVGAVHHKWRAGVVRGENRVISNYFPILKNRAYFSLRHNQNKLSIIEIKANWEAFASNCKMQLNWHILNGDLEVSDLVEFESQKIEAWDRALIASLMPAKTQKYYWLNKYEIGLAQPSLATKLKREMILISCRGASPMGSGGIINAVKEYAKGLVELGYVVKILYCDPKALRISDEHVDFVSGLWWINIAESPTHLRNYNNYVNNSLNLENQELPDSVKFFQSQLVTWLKWQTIFSSSNLVITQSWDAEGFLINRVPNSFQHIVMAYTPALKVAELSMDKEEQGLLSMLWEYELATLNSADLVIADSKALSTLLRSIGCKTKIRVSHLGTEMSEVSDPKPGKYFLFVGNLDPRKGFDWLFATWRQAVDTENYFNLKIVGINQNAFFQYCRDQNIDTTVLPEICGTVTRQELSELYRDCIAIILPSRWESFGLPIIEALKYRRPFIASDNSALRELALETGAGELVEFGDVRALLASINKMNHQEQERPGDRVQGIVREKFSRSSAAKRLDAILVDFFGDNR